MSGVKNSFLTAWMFLGRHVSPGTPGMSFLLAFLTTEAVIFSLEAADWVSPRPSLLLAAGVGGLLGLWVARARRLSFLRHIAALVLGLAYLLAATAMIVPETSWLDGFGEALRRTTLWATMIVEGSASTDRLPLGAVLAFAAGTTGYLTAYLALRFPSAWALVPSGMVLLSNLTYLPKSYLVYLFLFLLPAVLLLAHMLYVKRLAEWGRKEIQVRDRLGLHLLHYAVWFSVFVFGVALLLPKMDAGPGPVRETWNKLRSPLSGVEDHFARVLSSVPAKRDFGIYTFGTTLPFRGEISLSNAPAFLAVTPVEVYWQGRTYDVYESWGWTNSDELMTITVSPRGDILPRPSFPGRVLTETTIAPQTATQRLVYPGEPLKVSVAAQALAQPGVAGAAPPEIMNLRSQDFVGPEAPYSVQALLPDVMEEQLAEDDAPYPRWVEERYLGLPDTLPDRVDMLAEDLVRGAETTYDKVQAVQEYIRGIEYDQLVEAPPPGADGVDHFLFEAKAGYSDYHASAMAILLRVAGVPTRLVAGYLPGQFDEEVQAYVVREADAHAWTEVYFPSYGWIPFEPTTARPRLILAGPSPLGQTEDESEAEEDRSALTQGPLIDLEEDFPVGDFDDFGPLPGVAQTWGVRVLAVTVGTGITALVAIYLLLRLISRSRTPLQAYRWLIRLATLGGVNPRRYETPYEYGYRLQRYVPRHALAIQDIVHRYAVDIYAHRALADSGSHIPWGKLVWSFFSLGLWRLRGKATVAGGKRPAYEG